MNFEIGQHVIHTVTHIFNSGGKTSKKSFTVDAIVKGFSRNNKRVNIEFITGFGNKAAKLCDPETLKAADVQ